MRFESITDTVRDKYATQCINDFLNPSRPDPGRRENN